VLSKAEAISRLKSLGYPRPTDADQFVGSAFLGKAELVELFLAAGMPVDTPNGTGDHAFGMAVRGGFIAIADELLKAGADPRIADGNGTTPLMDLAGYCDETALFSAILAKGVDVNARAHGGQTALSEATSHDCKEIVRLLKKKGATR
jgi:ankyrin repeat protein